MSVPRRGGFGSVRNAVTYTPGGIVGVGVEVRVGVSDGVGVGGTGVAVGGTLVAVAVGGTAIATLVGEGGRGTGVANAGSVGVDAGADEHATSVNSPMASTSKATLFIDAP